MAYIMKFVKKVLFILSLIAGQLLVKTGAQTGDCGGTYTNLSGTISSPNYPSDYSDNLNCSYYIQISPANSVNITFISFSTEPVYDWLQIICGSGPPKDLPKFSGSALPPSLSLSSCSVVQLLFYSDNVNVGKGFSLKYDIGNGLQGGLTMKPMNLYVRRDSTEPIVLSCSSRANQPDAYPWWSFITDGYTFSGITAPDCSVLSSIDGSDRIYFSAAKDYTTRTCNLTISPSSINSTAATYSCTDATLDYAIALVTYIDPSFTAVDSNSLQTEVVRGDQISMICSIYFFQTTWYNLKLSSVNIYSDDNLRLAIVSNTPVSITNNFLVSSEVLPSFVCNINFTLSSDIPSGYATNLPQFSLKIPSKQVLYGPENTSMVIHGDDNGRVVANGILTCFVEANPPVTYQWAHEQTRLLWKGSTVTVTYNGTYTCIATNSIRGKTHEASKSINVTTTIIDCQKNESEDKFNSVALAVGVVLGIAVLLLLVVAIVEFVLLRKKKNSATSDVNYDYIDPATRTSAGPAIAHVYELTQRERLDVDQGGTVATSGHKDVPSIPPMYDRITSQTYDTEIHTEDKSQPYDTEIHTED